MTQSLYLINRAVIGTLVLLVASNAANAFVSDAPDSFLNSIITLKPEPGTLIPMPGVGPGGSTLYADSAFINSFSVFNSVVSGGDTTVTYNANLSALLLDQDGKPSGGAMSLPSNNSFVVRYLNRSNVNETGNFTTQLLQATFSGYSSSGNFINIFLENQPTAVTTIESITSGANVGKYNISSPPFEINSISSPLLNTSSLSTLLISSCGIHVPTGGCRMPKLEPIANAVPEPEEWAMLMVGIPLVSWQIRRKKIA